MSTQTKAAGLPDLQTAYDTLFQGVHGRVFFQSLAGRGIVPQSEKQASAMLEIAGKLRAYRESEGVKEAEQAADPFARANAALDNVLAGSGFTSRAKAAEAASARASAAAQLSADPGIYNAVLSMKAAEAEELNRQHAAFLQQSGRA